MLCLFFLFCSFVNRAENWVTEHLQLSFEIIQLSFEITGHCFLPILFLIHTSHFSGITYCKQALTILVISAEKYFKKKSKMTVADTG